MIGKTHTQITGAALVEEVSNNGLDLVIGGNTDSDALFTARGDYNVQHFSFSGNDQVQDARTQSRECKKFIYRSLDYAAVCFLGTHEYDMNFNLGFYFLGRLLHCAQDYYAHSNGVAIGFTNPNEVLGGHQEGLTFCTPTTYKLTPVDKYFYNFYGKTFVSTDHFMKMNDIEIRDHCNRNGIIINEKKLNNKLSRYRKRLCYVIRMQTKYSLAHQYMHLDFPGTNADTALKTILNRGYREAEAGAWQLSRILYKKLAAKIGKGAANIPNYDIRRRQLNIWPKTRGFKRIRRGDDSFLHREKAIVKLKTYKQHRKDKLERKDCAEIFDMCLRVRKEGQGIDRTMR